LAASELKAFDAVVFDPPRQGAEAQARELAASAAPTVVAVSCNPATFARDARILVASCRSHRSTNSCSPRMWN
jgi:23S rRNA (uracil1939-C5)-methyltransferase